MIHKLAHCQCDNIPDSTNIWQFCVVLPNAQIGENCNICANCFIENDVKIGNNCTLKCGVQLWDGIELEDNVMIGAGSVVTKNIPKNTLWMGNPAQMKGYITKDNITLDLQLRDKEGHIHDYSEINY